MSTAADRPQHAEWLLVLTGGFLLAVVGLDIVSQAGRLTAYGTPAGLAVLAVLAVTTLIAGRGLFEASPLQQSAWTAVLALACAVFVVYPAVIELS